MNKSKQTKSNPAALCKRDFLLILAVLAVAFLCYLLLFPKSSPTAVVVTQEGQEIARIPLSSVTSSYELSVEGDFPAVILVEPDGVRVLSASCPDKICVRTGKLTRAGQTVACLPARLTVTLQGPGSAVDGYTG